ncbi:integrase [Streptomyces pristinaespiralis]
MSAPSSTGSAPPASAAPRGGHRTEAVLCHRRVLPEAAVRFDRGVRALGPQVSPGTRRPRRRTAPQRRPERQSRRTWPRRFQPLTATEARQFLAAARTDRLHALYELALRTGLRKGELLGLHWGDLDLTTGTATIRRSLQRTQTGGLTTLLTKTRASERRIALPNECIHSFKEHREVQEGERTAAGEGWKDNGLVFSTPAGGSIRRTSIATSAPSSIAPGSAASASTTYGTPPPLSSWSKASTSS